jgi:hypothetical protein
VSVDNLIPREVKRNSRFVVAALIVLFLVLIYVIKNDSDRLQSFVAECAARPNGVVVKIDGHRACIDQSHIYEREKDHDGDHHH